MSIRGPWVPSIRTVVSYGVFGAVVTCLSSWYLAIVGPSSGRIYEITIFVNPTDAEKREPTAEIWFESTWHSMARAWQPYPHPIYLGDFRHQDNRTKWSGRLWDAERITELPHSSQSWGMLGSTRRFFNEKIESGSFWPDDHPIVALSFPAAREWASGWPLLALSCRQYQTPDLAWHESGVVKLPIWVLERLPSDWVTSWIPGRPIWSGIAVNSFLFGSTAFLLVRAVRFSRRVHRLNRGRCPACGYALCFDLSQGCSECGWRRPCGQRTGAGSLDPAPLD